MAFQGDCEGRSRVRVRGERARARERDGIFWGGSWRGQGFESRDKDRRCRLSLLFLDTPTDIGTVGRRAGHAVDLKIEVGDAKIDVCADIFFGIVYGDG